MNRLLYTALLLVTPLFTSPELQRHLNALRHRFAGIGTLTLGQTAPRAEELNRLQQRYTPVVELAHQFLDGQFLDARSGQQQVFSLLFDMNRLFERFTASRLRPEARSRGLRLIEQGPRRYLAEDDHGRSRLLMRPDITLVDETGALRAMIDTKWKQLGNADPIAALSASDLYQVATYAAAYHCSNLYLLYPEQPSLPAGLPRHLTLTGSQQTHVTVQGVCLNGKTVALGRESQCLLQELRSLNNVIFCFPALPSNLASAKFPLRKLTTILSGG